MKKIESNAGLKVQRMEEPVQKLHGSAGRWLTAVLLLAGLTGLVVPVFPSIPGGVVVTAAAEILMCWAVLGLAVWKSEKQELILIPFFLYLLVCFGRIRDGFLCLANDVLKILTDCTGRIHLPYEVQNPGNIIFALISIGFLLAFVTAEAVWYGWLLPELLLTVALLAGLACGILTPGAGAAFYVAGLILLLILRGQQRTADRIRSGFAIYGLLGLLLTGILILVALPAGTAQNTTLERWKQWYHQHTYDTATTSMPEGKLKNLGAWKKSETAALSLQADSYEKLYLRGMTGEVYTGTSWKELPAKERADEEDLFYWLHKDGFYGQEMIGKAADVTDSEAELQTMQVQNLAACRGHLYLPYGLQGTELLEPDLIGDAQTASGETEWNMTYRSGSVPAWYGILQKLSKEQQEPEIAEYLRQEESYREYVNKKDLELTESARQTLDRLLPESEGSLSLSEIKERIFQCLEENLTYDEGTMTASGSQDFLSYTLEQKRKGYSVHYATAATLMLRYYGVPARYVEGYLLTRDKAKQATPGEPLILDETCAHAWAEYYLDGIGWIPFETTPGYIDPEEIGVDENGGSDQGYQAQSKSYTQQETMEQTEVSQEQSHWSVNFSYLMILAVLLILFGCLFWILYRHQKLRKQLEQMKDLPPKEAIPAWYGYARCLGRHCEVTDGEGQEQAMHQLNDEALFSDHEMTEEQKAAMIAYAEEVKAACLEQWSRMERWKYQWVVNIL